MDYSSSFGKIERVDSRVSDFPVESKFQECVKGLVRGQLREESGAGYLQSCDVLKVILKNLLEHGDNERFKVVYTKNQRFQDTVGKYPAGVFLMELLGFVRVDDTKPYFMYCEENPRQLKE